MAASRSWFLFLDTARIPGRNHGYVLCPNRNVGEETLAALATKARRNEGGENYYSVSRRVIQITNGTAREGHELLVLGGVSPPASNTRLSSVKYLLMALLERITVKDIAAIRGSPGIVHTADWLLNFEEDLERELAKLGIQLAPARLVESLATSPKKRISIMQFIAALIIFLAACKGVTKLVGWMNISPINGGTEGTQKLGPWAQWHVGKKDSYQAFFKATGFTDQKEESKSFEKDAEEWAKMIWHEFVFDKKLPPDLSPASLDALSSVEAVATAKPFGGGASSEATPQDWFYDVLDNRVSKRDPNLKTACELLKKCSDKLEIKKPDAGKKFHSELQKLFTAPDVQKLLKEKSLSPHDFKLVTPLDVKRLDVITFLEGKKRDELRDNLDPDAKKVFAAARDSKPD